MPSKHWVAGSSPAGTTTYFARERMESAVITLIVVLSTILLVGIVGGIIVAVGKGFYNLMTRPVWIMTLIAAIAILAHFVR